MGGLVHRIKVHLSKLFVTLYAYYVYRYSKTRDPFFLYYPIAAFLFATSISGLKKWLAKRYPTVGMFRRPEGAMECGMFGGGGLAEGDPGFPSVHMVVTTFLLYGLVRDEPTKHLYIYAVLYFLMAYARSECHTTEQMAAGTIVGLVGGIATYKLLR